MQETIITRLEAARKELLDLGLRNPLLHYRRPAGRGVQIVGEDASALFRLLVNEERTLTFLAAPEKADGQEWSPADEARTDTRLQTPETEDALQARLLQTYYAARTSIEEQGVNILYLSLGMLHWYEAADSKEGRLAPLILIPVALERSSARERFRLRYTLEELGENLSLQAKLKAEFGIGLPDLPEDDDFSPEAYFREIESAVAHQPRWKVERHAIELGFFSFGKFLIYNDLDNEKWPEEIHPVEHPVLRSLFGSGFTDAPPSAGEESFIDTETEAGQLFQVVDADSSQVLALLAVHEGRNLVIQGPPGTGKSQTITNIIANAVGHGKKVLFVAEKLAALEVVKRRLDSIGLGDACLELHSHKANKKELHEELRRVIDLGRPALHKLQQEVALLENYKEELNAYTMAVNAEIGRSGLSAHRVMGLLLQLAERTGTQGLPRIFFPDLAQWDALRMQEAEDMADRMAAQLKTIGVPRKGLFWGVGLRVLLPHEAEALAGELQAAGTATQALQEAVVQVSAAMGLTAPANRDEAMRLSALAGSAASRPDLGGLAIENEAWLLQRADIHELLEAGSRLHELRQQYEEVFLPEAWEQEVLGLRQDLVEHGEKWYRFAIGDYNRSNKRLKSFLKGPAPKEPSEKLRYVDAILDARRQESVLKEHEALAHALFSRRWQGRKSDWPALGAASAYLEEVHRKVAAQEIPAAFIAYLSRGENPEAAQRYQQLLLERLNSQGKAVQSVTTRLALNESLRFGGKTLLHLAFTDQASLLQDWAGRLPEIHQAISWNNMVDRAEAACLAPLAAAATDWEEAAEGLKAALQKTWYEHLLEVAVTAQPALRKFERTAHEEVIRQFQRLDALNLQYNRARVALRHWEGMPDPQGGGQVTVLRTEFNKKARHLPIRKLMIGAGLAVQAVKPVFMMSPLSIANFLPPGALDFDLVVFDEASQVRPVEALGALLRGRQLVVVGDTKQLPPTSFFDSLSREIDEEDSVTADLPSILSLCDAQGAPQRMLRWHYRSRHESLIMLSNHEFYENRLVVFPSPGARHRQGLVFHHLKDTAYDRGKTRTNPKEAETVAEAVMEHARKHPKQSLGVVAFSSAQRQAIQDALELKRKAHPELEVFFRSHPHEPFFVKNLENVQGDERDVIYISIGYGRTAEGYLSMNFGPLNNEGGEKRLNVLITRARQRCEVFTNITADDIDSNKTSSYGVRTLKRFLRYARHGYIDTPQSSGREAGSPFEEAVERALVRLGYAVHRQVGSKGFYLDLAIVDPEHPGRYILGIECDGAAYHSARSARDRDRLRQQVLEGIGWSIHRIWSTDWFRHPERELKRVVEAIDKAWKRSLDEPEEDDEDETVLLVREAAEGAQSVQPYLAAVPPAELAQKEVHLHPVGRLADWVVGVVQVESPVHVDEVTRRIVESAGVNRIGPRIREHIRLAVRFAEGSGRIRNREDFLWVNGMEQPPLRDRSELPAASRKLKYVAPEELALAIRQVVADSVAISAEATVPLVARLLGFARVTEDGKAIILNRIDDEVARGGLTREGDLLRG